MIEFKAKLWRAIGAATLLGAGVALSGCGQADTTAKTDAVKTGEAGEAAIGEGGGEQGEAGTEEAYQGLDPAQLSGLKLQYMRGFLILAEQLRAGGQTAEAAVLIDQGAQEIMGDGAAAPGFDPALLKKASAAAGAGDQEGLKAALASLEALQSGAGAEPSVEQMRRLIQIARGVYGHAVTAEGVDPVEYQHSLAAAMAANDVLTRIAPDLQARHRGRMLAVKQDMDTFAGLWLGPSAPASPTPAGEIMAQASRLELALYGL